MKKVALYILIQLCSSLSYAQSDDIYYQIRKSWLDSLRYLIANDLTTDSIKFENHDWRWFGDVFIFEVAFDSIDSYMIEIGGVTEKIQKQFYKQRSGFSFKKLQKITKFENYIKKNNDIPYDLLDHVSYSFLLYRGESSDVLFGKYQFKVSKSKISIVAKKTEILNAAKIIQEIYDTCF
jgi:hypothetical protein